MTASLCFAMAAPALCAGDGPADTEKVRAVPAAIAARQVEPAYSVQVGIDGEVFPALANYAALQSPQDRTLATVTVKIANHSGTALHDRVQVRVRGWSDEEIQPANLNPGETRNLMFAPVFLPRLFTNREIVAATAVVTVYDSSNRVAFATTAPVRLRSVDDMYWGQQFKYARFIASWVTPHDPAVEQILTKAKEFMPGRRLPGYEPWKSAADQRASTLQQAGAIYHALQQKGVSYVKSSITFGKNTSVSERVRMPYESLRQVSANCIDGVVMYASLFENLGMDAEVILVPGHAYVAVRAAQSGGDFLYLDTVLTGRASFESAVQTATQGLQRLNPKERHAYHDPRRPQRWRLPHAWAGYRERGQGRPGGQPRRIIPLTPATLFAITTSNRQPGACSGVPVNLGSFPGDGSNFGTLRYLTTFRPELESPHNFPV